jgi:NAD(P)-dependent dehydrogenase (short-subunit alcohol dehydrogenase family)
MSMQLELGDSPVRVVDLQPGDISTDFNKSVIASAKADLYNGKIEKTWRTVERNMNKAPGPEFVAQQILRLINAMQPPPRVAVGDVFESKIAPLIFRFLPQRVRIWGLKKYYGI